MDSDDWIYENHLEEANRMIEQHQSPAWFHLGYEMRTPEGNLISQYNQRVGNLGNLMIEGNQLSCIGVFIRKEIMEANLFNETRALSGSEDWEVWTRMASRYSLYYSNTVTSCIVNHEDRSVLNIKEQPLLERIMLAGNLLMQDKPFMEHFGKRVPQMWAHLYFYMALHLVMSKQLGRGWHYVWKAIHSYPPILFTKKFLGILRQSTRV